MNISDKTRKARLEETSEETCELLTRKINDYQFHIDEGDLTGCTKVKVQGWINSWKALREQLTGMPFSKVTLNEFDLGTVVFNRVINIFDT
jgi:hypothetical protein